MFRPMFNTADFLRQGESFRKFILDHEEAGEQNGYGSPQQGHPSTMNVETGSAPPTSSYFNSLMSPERPMNPRRPSHQQSQQKPRQPQRYRRPQQVTPTFYPTTTMKTTTTTTTTRRPRPSYNRGSNNNNNKNKLSTSMSYQQMNMGTTPPPRTTSVPASPNKYYKPRKNSNQNRNTTPRPQSTAFVFSSSYRFGQKITGSKDAYGTPQSEPISNQGVPQEPSSGNSPRGQKERNQAVNQMRYMMNQGGNQNVNQEDKFSSPRGNGSQESQGDQSQLKTQNPFTKKTKIGMDETGKDSENAELETTSYKKFPPSPFPEVTSEMPMLMAMMSTSTTTPPPPSQSSSYQSQRQAISGPSEPSAPTQSQPSRILSSHPTLPSQPPSYARPTISTTSSPTTTSRTTASTTTTTPSMTPGPIYYKPMPPMDENVPSADAAPKATKAETSSSPMKSPTSEPSDSPGKSSTAVGDSHDQQESPSDNEVRYYRSYRSLATPLRRRRFRRSSLS